MDPKMTVDYYGSKIWKLNGDLHRTDGPAVERNDGYKEYWIQGKQYTEEEYKKKSLDNN